MDAPGQPWTGQLTFELLDLASRPASSMHVVLRRDLATIGIGERNLAVFDRERLRAWVSTRADELDRHDISLSAHGDWTAIRIQGGAPAWITPEDFQRLAAVV